MARMLLTDLKGTFLHHKLLHIHRKERILQKKRKRAAGRFKGIRNEILRQYKKILQKKQSKK